MRLAAAILLIAVFTANVALGSRNGGAFLGDVGEMLVLFAASIAFVAAILAKEAAQRKD
ncbi:MAG: hypothetical protein AAF360_10360 [Pseudomonadota bacterium]